ncbi:hypothetical protein [Spiroplasma endosymbiont of Seladonia tumulorum]|uniref:hypothetical protein n=1 Tax=Spiroplasma endosymbiont of Seladonia tumulorum TaxID=3066321 RepID=UPI0030CA7CB5
MLPAIGGVGKLTRAARTTRILKLAKETKLLEKLGVITANNLEDVVKQVTGKKILSDKLIFDFKKQANNETLLYTFGKLARNDFYKGFKVSNLETINNLLKIEKNIQKISPTLVQKIPRVNEKNANKLLYEYGLNIDKISKINTNEWYNIMTNLHKKGVGKNLLLNANLMRSSKIYNNKLLNIFHQTPIKLNKILNHLNPNFYIQKVTKKLLAPIEKQIITIKQKVINKITDKTKKIFSKFETKAIKKSQLLPFAYGSDVFLAVKIVPLSVAGEVALTIYYKNPKYVPIVVMTTLIKAEQFVLAPEPFKFYMNSEWFIGWGFKKTSLFNFVSFANFKILVVRAARVNLPTPPIAGNKFKAVLFAVTSDVNLSYIWFTAKSVAVSTPNEINAAAKLDNPVPRPTAEAIPPVKTDKPRAKTWIPKNSNNCKPKFFLVVGLTI